MLCVWRGYTHNYSLQNNYRLAKSYVNRNGVRPVINDFSMKVYDVVRQIPEGCVATYGQVARLAGSPGAARAVGNALHRNPYPGEVPCHRVVNAKGRLAKSFGFGGAIRQKELLEAEGVVVVNFAVNLGVYQWS